MKIHFLFLLMLTIILLNGCATTRNIELTAVASPDQETDPYGAIVSEKRNMVSILHYNLINYMRDNAIFIIIIENGGEEPLTIDNENISITFRGNNKKRTVKKLDMQSAAELMQDIDYEYSKKMINDMVRINLETDYRKAYALSDGGPVAAEYFNVFPPRSSGSLNLSNNFLIARSLGLAETSRRLKTLKETLPDLILSQKTIMPRESIRILISCRTHGIPRRIKGDFKINVSIDGEEHRFTFTRI